MARELYQVIKECLTTVPEDEKDLIVAFENLYSSVIYTPPEAMGRRWAAAQRIIAEKFPHTKEELNEWQKKFLTIWTGKEII